MVYPGRITPPTIHHTHNEVGAWHPSHAAKSTTPTQPNGTATNPTRSRIANYGPSQPRRAQTNPNLPHPPDPHPPPTHGNLTQPNPAARRRAWRAVVPEMYLLFTLGSILRKLKKHMPASFAYISLRYHVLPPCSLCVRPAMLRHHHINVQSYERETPNAPQTSCKR